MGRGEAVERTPHIGRRIHQQSGSPTLKRAGCVAHRLTGEVEAGLRLSARPALCELSFACLPLGVFIKAKDPLTHLTQVPCILQLAEVQG